MMGKSYLPFLPALLALGFAASPSAHAADPPELEQARVEFTTLARPLLTTYCLECHSAESLEGDLDLDRFATLADVRKETGVWLKVAEMLDNGEMPPKDARRMPAADRKTLRDWLSRYLRAEALANAGDPGPVILRRLSNAQYTYTLRDLTGIPLDPAREFPVDGAAGEGFTNTGNALVMSPALLTKYFDAAKEVASHAVPLPDGFRFSAGTTRRDWTDEILGQIRDFYSRFTDSGGSTEVNLQGIVFATNGGGRLPLERYLEATLSARDALASGSTTIEAVALERNLSPKYLDLLWNTLNATEPAPLLDEIRARWKSAQPADATPLAQAIGRWQSRLWAFNSVGHIGKVGGPKSWMQPVSPLLSRQEFRIPIPAPASGSNPTLYLATDHAGDGPEHDTVIWDRPRLVAPGMPEILLRDVPALAARLQERRERIFANTAASLAAASEASASTQGFDPAELARKHAVPPDVLAAWFNYLGLGSGGPVTITSHLQGKIEKSAGYEFVNGWGPGETPNLVANASDTHVRVPGNLKPHSVAIHPAPTLKVAVGWLSPVSASLKIQATIQHAHPECGNGVTWALELRRGATRQRLAAGVSQGAKLIPVGPFEAVPVRPGDLVSLLVGPRDGNHACDLTAVDLTLATSDRTWDLAADVSPDVLAGNPHADRLGNPAVWHFYTEPDRGGDPESTIPAGSILARWQLATTPAERDTLAQQAQVLLTAPAPQANDSPDAALYRQLVSVRGPIFRAALADLEKPAVDAPVPALGSTPFGRLPSGDPIESASLAVKAPSVIPITIPAELAEGCEFVTSATLAPSDSAGSVQLAVTTEKPTPQSQADPARPILLAAEGPTRNRFEAAFNTIRSLFPPALCYTKIVPVDEVVTLTLFYREDDQLRRLLLNDAQAAELDRLWDELHFVSQDAFTLVDAFQQLLEYASQDGDPKLFEPLRGPIEARAATFRRTLTEAEPKQLSSVIDFAARAYRRPLSPAESATLRDLYQKLRSEGLPHDDAWRLVLARVLVAPAFLYRVETPGPGTSPTPLSDGELASRLSYFLWSSTPDDELRRLAESGQLRDPDILASQARRMLRDDRVRRLATEFACQWLHVYEFDALDEKSERHFPDFKALRGPMYEETILFFTDYFQHDRPTLSFLDSDATFLNEPLANHYGIPGVTGNNYRRVEGIKAFGRGGILGLSTTLARQSGASRTSPILRGNWVSEVLLGEKLPKPPPGVPQLPEDEASTGGLSVREIVERHSRDPKCATCHVRIDPFGYSLEAYDAIGRRRDRDLGGRPIEVAATLRDGTAFDGLDGLRGYLLTNRREAVARQFSRKLLGYALGRGVQLSDEPLLDEMTRRIVAGESIGALIEAVVRSPQFRQIRGRETLTADAG